MKTPTLQVLKFAVVLLPALLAACQSSGHKAADGTEECDRCEMKLVQHERKFGESKSTAYDKQMKCGECEMTTTTGQKYDADKLCICCGGTLTECHAD